MFRDAAELLFSALGFLNKVFLQRTALCARASEARHCTLRIRDRSTRQPPVPFGPRVALIYGHAPVMPCCGLALLVNG